MKRCMLVRMTAVLAALAILSGGVGGNAAEQPI